MLRSWLSVSWIFSTLLMLCSWPSLRTVRPAPDASFWTFSWNFQQSLDATPWTFSWNCWTPSWRHASRGSTKVLMLAPSSNTLLMLRSSLFLWIFRKASSWCYALNSLFSWCIASWLAFARISTDSWCLAPSILLEHSSALLTPHCQLRRALNATLLSLSWDGRLRIFSWNVLAALLVLRSKLSAGNSNTLFMQRIDFSWSIPGGSWCHALGFSWNIQHALFATLLAPTQPFRLCSQRALGTSTFSWFCVLSLVLFRFEHPLGNSHAFLMQR